MMRKKLSSNAKDKSKHIEIEFRMLFGIKISVSPKFLPFTKTLQSILKILIAFVWLYLLVSFAPHHTLRHVVSLAQVISTLMR